MSENNKLTSVIGVFRKRLTAEACLTALLGRDYASKDINLMMSDKTRDRDYSSKQVASKTEAGSYMTEGVGVGGAIGTAVGATIAAIAAIGTSVLLPGLNLIVAGPIFAALAGAGAGAVTGGIAGGLIGLGMTEQDAKYYNKALEEGGVVMSVAVRDSKESGEVRKLMATHSGEQICAC